MAERYGVTVVQTLLRLAQDPFAGRPRRFRNPQLNGIRSITVARPFNSHLVFYRVQGEIVVVVRVLHGARDLPRRLRQPPGSDD